MPEDPSPRLSFADAGPLLIAGRLTLDRFADETPVRESPGGAVLFAARTAEAFGIRPLVLTKMNREPLLFEHSHVDGERRLRLEHPPRSPIGAIDVPSGWPEPRTILLCPLIPGDLDVASFLDLAGYASGAARAGAPATAVGRWLSTRGRRTVAGAARCGAGTRDDLPCAGRGRTMVAGGARAPCLARGARGCD